MRAFRMGIGLKEFATFKEFAEDEKLGPEDLVITNEYIYEPVISSLNLGVQTLFQEQYGAGEPTDLMLNKILEDLAKTKFNRIIAVGGGTVIDISKAVSVAVAGDTTDTLFDRKDSLTRQHPLIIVPTTCGTGSEVTNIAVFNRTKLGTKMGLTSENMYADQAALIAGMLDTLPYKVFATSSIDAMVHSVESYLSPNRCSISMLFSESALRLIVSHWKKFVEEGGGEAWKKYKAEFLRASNWAGIGFAYGGCAAVHALSYPIGGIHHVPHGQSNQLMFAAVMKKYKELKPVGTINDLEAILGEELGVPAEQGLEALYTLMDKVLKTDPLHEHGVTADELPGYAKSVLAEQQRLLKNNYVPLTEEDILSIYKSAL
ncbi:MAG: iron-containing alcohol dehydrogenase [Bilifractor sp.]